MIETKRTSFLVANLTYTRARLRAIGGRFEAGEIDARTFERLMAGEIREAAAAQFRATTRRLPTDADLAALNDVLARHGAYLAAFTDEIGRADNPGGVAARAALYGGAATEAGATGRVLGAGALDRVRWIGPDGPSSCRSCASYIGRTWARDEFLALGVVPGRGTACAGACRCRLVVVRHHPEAEAGELAAAG